ncbi:MAG TPA: DUF3667 domain-containing protein [Candidatus Didemnitutus sp.]|nr:DUF3667 domain-containing protein [Candidatus Didemnitutus sp.]
MSDHSAPPAHAACQNCGAELHGPFCHRCGQHDFEFHRSFGHVFLEALENFFHFDEKFFRNVFTLLFRPGRLSADFNAGKRAGQMPPFRLYLFISVLFFLARLLHGGGNDLPAQVNGDRDTRESLAEAVASAATDSKDPAAKQRLENLRQELLDPTLKAVKLTAEQERDLPAILEQKIRRELAGKDRTHNQDLSREEAKAKTPLERALSEKAEFALSHQEEIKEAYTHAVPKMLLICLPLFALYTRILFRKAGLFYLQHLIIAIHYHTFVFLWWMVSEGWTGLVGLLSPIVAGIIGLAATLWMLIYPVIMLRRLFGQSWPLTILKAAVLTLVYGLTITAGLAITAIVVVAMV